MNWRRQGAGTEMTREDEAYAVQTAVLTSPGHTSRQLRRAVEQRVALASGREGGVPPAIPPELETYVDKITHHAYKITDDDAAALKQAGYSEDAIFEITAAAATGAQMGRLERALGALRRYRELYEPDTGRQDDEA
jgi:hypothetical protein